jgi:hypothetical protein
MILGDVLGSMDNSNLLVFSHSIPYIRLSDLVLHQLHLTLTLTSKSRVDRIPQLTW